MKYEEPSMLIVTFEMTEIITESNPSIGEGDDNYDPSYDFSGK